MCIVKKCKKKKKDNLLKISSHSHECFTGKLKVTRFKKTILNHECKLINTPVCCSPPSAGRPRAGNAAYAGAWTSTATPCQALTER